MKNEENSIKKLIYSMLKIITYSKLCPIVSVCVNLNYKNTSQIYEKNRNVNKKANKELFIV